MNSNIMINSEAFEDYINKFDSKLVEIQDTFNSMSIDMRDIDGESNIWKSKSAKLVHDKFANIEKTFEAINSDLSVFSLFLKDVLEEYKEEQENEIRKLDNNDSYLDVNE